MLWDAKFDMTLRHHNDPTVAKMAVSGTKFEPVLRIFNEHTALGFCRDPDVPKLLAVSKKMPDFILMGVIIDDRLLHRADMEIYGEAKNITAMRGKFCHTLSTVSGMQLSSTLLSNIHALSHSLTTYSGTDTSNDSSKENVEKSSDEPSSPV